MRVTAFRSHTIMESINSGRIAWNVLSLSQKMELIDQVILSREQPGIECMTSISAMNSVITNQRKPGSFLYMFFSRTIEIRGLEKTAREIELIENNLELAKCFVAMFGVERAHLLSKSLANKVKGARLEDELGL